MCVFCNFVSLAAYLTRNEPIVLISNILLFVCLSFHIIFWWILLICAIGIHIVGKFNCLVFWAIPRSMISLCRSKTHQFFFIFISSNSTSCSVLFSSLCQRFLWWVSLFIVGILTTKSKFFKKSQRFSYFPSLILFQCLNFCNLASSAILNISQEMIGNIFFHTICDSAFALYFSSCFKIFRVRLLISMIHLRQPQIQRLAMGRVSTFSFSASGIFRFWFLYVLFIYTTIWVLIRGTNRLCREMAHLFSQLVLIDSPTLWSIFTNSIFILSSLPSYHGTFQLPLSYHPCNWYALSDQLNWLIFFISWFSSLSLI